MWLSIIHFELNFIFDFQLFIVGTFKGILRLKSKLKESNSKNFKLHDKNNPYKQLLLGYSVFIMNINPICYKLNRLRISRYNHWWPYINDLTNTTVSPFLREHITLQLVVTPHFASNTTSVCLRVTTPVAGWRLHRGASEGLFCGRGGGVQTKAMQIKPTTVT